MARPSPGRCGRRVRTRGACATGGAKVASPGGPYRGGPGTRTARGPGWRAGGAGRRTPVARALVRTADVGVVPLGAAGRGLGSLPADTRDPGRGARHGAESALAE